MIMTKKEQFKVLETMMYALEDIKRMRTNPFSLKDEPISPEIIQEAVGKYSKSVPK